MHSIHRDNRFLDPAKASKFLTQHPRIDCRIPPARILRSAAHQPIDWHEWNDEAFARANREDKPILLDIGAVWCHWCHVIDRESYENPDIAQDHQRTFRGHQSGSRRAARRGFALPVRHQRHFRPGRLAADRISSCRTANHFSAAPIFRRKTTWAARDFAAFCWPSPILSRTSGRI